MVFPQTEKLRKHRLLDYSLNFQTWPLLNRRLPLCLHSSPEMLPASPRLANHRSVDNNLSFRLCLIVVLDIEHHAWMWLFILIHGVMLVA